MIYEYIIFITFYRSWLIKRHKLFIFYVYVGLYIENRKSLEIIRQKPVSGWILMISINWIYEIKYIEVSHGSRTTHALTAVVDVTKGNNPCYTKGSTNNIRRLFSSFQSLFCHNHNQNIEVAECIPVRSYYWCRHQWLNISIRSATL